MKAACVILLAAIAAIDACSNDWSQSKDGKKCYFTAPLLKLSSFYDQITYCSYIGGKVVEPANKEEFEEVKAIAKSAGNWTDGPWINYISPFADGRIVSANTLQEPQDADLVASLKQLFTQFFSIHKRCVGIEADGATVNFDDCWIHANPFCEKAN